jgi:hypothetical protein
MNILKTLFNKKYHKNLYSNMYRWLTPENQLELHRITNNSLISKKDRINQITDFIESKSIKSTFDLYGGKEVNINMFSKYIFNLKNN